MKLGDDECRHRHRDWEPFDEISIRLVPRYKTSGLSGSEWRVSAVVELKFKGEVMVERSYGRIEAAIRYLDTMVLDSCSPLPERLMDFEKEMCDQPSCQEKHISKYKLKKLYSLQGDELVGLDLPWIYTRCFCSKHLRRGDSSLEDGDANYEVLSGSGPEGHQMPPDDESPAVFGGIINLDDQSSTQED